MDYIHELPIDYPKISIITPSFNQGPYIEDTIELIVLQNYPNLEYMIFDGGSEDNSVEIIKKYEKWIDYWESTPDNGQAHAINKGFSKCTGDLIGWINSDDMLLPNSLEKLAKAYLENPEKILLGDVFHHYEVLNKTKLIYQKNVNFENVVLIPNSKAMWQQPGTFVPARLFQPNKVYLDESLRYVFDQDWMCKLLSNAGVFYLHDAISIFRVHSTSKTVSEKSNWLPELEIVRNRYWDQIPNINKKKIMANFEVIKASFSLGVKNWNHVIGRNKLIYAFVLYPKIAFSFKFIGYFLRSYLPFTLIKFLRSTLIKLRIFSPSD